MAKQWTAEEYHTAGSKVYDAHNRVGKPYYSTSDTHKENWIAGVYNQVDNVAHDYTIKQQCEINDALGIIEQYRSMIRSILADRPVHNVSLLESAADVWLERNKK